MSIRKIALDLDEVLVPLLRPMAKWRGVQMPHGKHPYLYREVFQCTEEQSQEILHKFYRSKDFLYLKPIPGAQRAMQILKNTRDIDKLYVVTGRQDIVRETTELWVERYFPGVFDDVILTNSFTEHEVKKADLCRALGVGLIIDDSYQTCDECRDAGIDAVNFIGFDDEIYPWCEESDISLMDWKNFTPTQI